MRIINWEDFTAQKIPEKGMAATIGVFDGVHLGHQRLIQKVAAVAEKEDLIPTVITFFSNPKKLLRPETFQGNIISQKLKLEILDSFHISQVVLIDFSGNFSKLEGREFIDLLRNQGNLRYLVIGSDFRCGYKLDTGASLIKEMNAVHGISTDAAEPVTAGGVFISSSRIRAAILSGDLVEARQLFGRNFKIDVSGMSKTPGNGEIIFDAAASNQITPPKGRYPVLVYQMNSGEGIKTEIFIENGNIHLSSQFNADSIEFNS